MKWWVIVDFFEGVKPWKLYIDGSISGPVCSVRVLIIYSQRLWQYILLQNSLLVGVYK